MKGGGTLRGVVAVSLVLVSSSCVKPAPQGADGRAAPCTLAAPPSSQLDAPETVVAQEPADGSRLKVGLAFDIGGRGDTSFNDAAAAGLDRAVEQLRLRPENRAERSPSAGEAESDKEARLARLAQDGYTSIIAVGFAYAPGLQTVAQQFPDTHFAIIDAAVPGPNVTSVEFAEEQASFLAGVVAAYTSKTCHVGFVGGVDNPLIHKFEAGFVQGARAAAPRIAIERKYLSPAGDNAGFQDPAKGRITANGELLRGADVIYQAAGASGKGVIQAVAAAGKLAIGVDSDQHEQQNLGEARFSVLTSVVKRVDVAVFDYLRAVALGQLAAFPKRFDLALGGVGLATSGGGIDELQPVLAAYRRAIVAGQIHVAATRSELRE
ncbi:basic membrane lipoprotein [Segniliparus rotundus DSM 44985]|uniref:Basic membrane lipoprotein n=1 Tax=Segniliparus rotundus (strain ATCC BAA-972 / CDC 1076 / CIP 108378 / DSM 44985 / JCM 13578) TaxID=640132 RepID=D6ZEW5_SEGRD|nr:basic membrane lipoprotein [Segniliparus rotundus DSM 44985]